MADPIQLIDLHPFEYEHPFDAKALDALQKVPGLDKVVREFSKQYIERLITIQETGSHIRVNKDNYPQLYNLLDQVCSTLNLPSRPALYIEGGGSINGFTIGVENPIIVITAGAVDFLDDQELLCLIGHEVGHIKSRHVLYHQMASYLPILAQIVGQSTLGLGTLLSYPIQLALFQWSRMSEFTADRAGLLACQDITSAIRLDAKLSGTPVKYYNDLRIETFIQQAKDFEDLDYDNLNKIAKVWSAMEHTHPWGVLRAAELLRWIEGGEYRQVIDRQTVDRVYKRYNNEKAYCRTCGFQLDDANAKFCPSCGKRLGSKT